MEISWCNLAPSNPKSLFSWPWKKVHGFSSTFSWDFHEKEICSETRYNNLKSSLNSSLRSSHIWFSYIQNFIIILSRVYNEPFQRPAPSWLVSLIGRALHRYRRGQGLESRTTWIFFRLSSRNCKNCVYNCDDNPSFKSQFLILRQINITGQ